MNHNIPKNYDHKTREQIWQKFWERGEIFKFDEKSEAPVYSIDTPPPYVSAEHLHLGHMMSYSQAEFVVRFKRMQGFNVFYPMGFDDNGLPTERYVEKKYNLNKSKISPKEFIKKCLEETKLGAENYKKLWTSFGISCDWSKTYSTINPHCQKISQWSFLDLYKKGKIVRREEPTYWCPQCQTALAQADLEDKEEESLIFEIQFMTNDGKLLVIATTRPELLPACAALFFHPSDARYLSLKNKKAIIPFFGQKVPILSDLSVDKNFGTGLMMVCTWGDIEDIKKWKKYKLETRAMIDKQGCLTKLAQKYKGQKILQARKNILTDLEKEKKLKKQEKIKHILNAHERCGTAAEFVLTRQWFISLLENKNEFLSRGKELRWYPAYMKSRYDDWVRALQWDWCISRQRRFGVPFPVWYCKKCKAVILPKEKDLPVDPREEKPKIKECQKCHGKEFVGEADVMDTWMTSSMTPLIGARLVGDAKIQKKLYPTTLRPQAFEIIRTWLFYTVVKSHYHYHGLPFFDVMISGHGLDEKGRKISKRLKNYVDPQKLLVQFGADAIRYWATGATLGENMRYSQEEIKKGKRTVTKIWNAARFCFLHITDFKPNKSFRPQDFCDRWILDELQKTIAAMTKFFENYEYSQARRAIENFFWHNFCDRYLEFVKFRLYEVKSSHDLELAKNTLYFVLLSVIKLYAPILPFITEEIYQLYFRKTEKAVSIHQGSWPKARGEFSRPEKERLEFKKVLVVADVIRKYKTEKGISLAKEIEFFEVKDNEIKEKYSEFLQKSLRVKKIV
jgi:valyl-tRNA synthetase